MSRLRWILLGGLVLLLVVAGAAFAVDRSQSETIAKGVTIAGIDVGGLDSTAARARVKAAIDDRNAPVTVTGAGRTWRITPRQAGAEVNVDSAVSDAVSRSRGGWFGERVVRSITGGQVAANIQPQVTLSSPAVHRFVVDVANGLDRKPVEAHLVYGPSSLGTAAGSPGRVVRRHQLEADVAGALADLPARPVEIREAVRTVDPKTSEKGLAERYPTVITVSRSGFRLYLWKGLKLDRSYPIAVGMAGLETPAGLYSIQDKQMNPYWHVPKSAWAGALAGKVIPPGPDNPIKARWMGVAAGAGIHGTSAEGSLGSAASHGCIRMAVSDVIDLYDRVPVGTPVYIS